MHGHVLGLLRVALRRRAAVEVGAKRDQNLTLPDPEEPSGVNKTSDKYKRYLYVKAYLGAVYLRATRDTDGNITSLNLFATAPINLLAPTTEKDASVIYNPTVKGAPLFPFPGTLKVR